MNGELTVVSGSGRIGRLDLLRMRRLVVRPKSRLGYMSICRGPLSLRLGTSASLGNRSTGARALHGFTYRAAQLWLAPGVKVTAVYFPDCARTVWIGDYAILAGKSSQIWTPGYVRDDAVSGRYRVDGSLRIGSNAFIGSRVIITDGVSIFDASSIGIGAGVTKSLMEPAFYVSGSPRIILEPADPANCVCMERVSVSELVESVYSTRNVHS